MTAVSFRKHREAKINVELFRISSTTARVGCVLCGREMQRVGERESG